MMMDSDLSDSIITHPSGKEDLTDNGYEELALRFLSDSYLYTIIESGDMEAVTKMAKELYIFTALQINELRLVVSEQALVTRTREDYT